jgi:hypothetical protein
MPTANPRKGSPERLGETWLLNMDGQWPSDLEAYARRKKNQLRRVRSRLQEVGRLLIQYALTKARAMRELAGGTLQEAVRLEHNCEAIYGDLPDWARW